MSNLIVFFDFDEEYIHPEYYTFYDIVYEDNNEINCVLEFLEGYDDHYDEIKNDILFHNNPFQYISKRYGWTIIGQCYNENVNAKTPKILIKDNFLKTKKATLFLYETQEEFMEQIQNKFKISSLDKLLENHLLFK